ncbi:thioester domain-containing protein, partial [Intestinimonas sp. MSJ-38]|uniref:thioester domain-containing protein n=1 Tax=Intestinimonas sp. MSJ-38 TaxID=2841532 RepID=UPI001C10A65D
MKARRWTALLLLVVTLVGMLPGAALAANTPEEALGEISIYNGGEQLAYLAVNGRVQKLNYVYFEHNSPTGIKQIPAYCVNPTTDGVPQVVGTGQSIKYLAQNQATDPKIVGIVGNGYPHRSLEELGLDNVQQAYYATKIALWCYLVPTWSIDKVTIAPGLSEHEQQIAQRLLAAAKDIYNRGSGWTDVLIPGLTVSSDQQNAYEVQINGETYLQQVYTVKSGTWVDGLEISVWFDGENVPSGMKIVNMDNQEIEKIPVGSAGYQSQFKVICPKASVSGSVNAKLLLEGNVNQYAAFYAVCQETGTYGKLQNYIADTDPVRTTWSNAIFKYSPPPEGGGGEYSLKIIKTETGTGTRLEGALFEVKDPDGAPVGTFSTNARGEILVPLERGGLYTITEVQPPKGHLMAKNPVQQVQVEKDTVATVSYENEPYGNLRVEKVDADTGDTLPGAKVQIKHIESGATYTQITNEAGVAIFNGLKPGAYEIVELEAPDGWIKNGQTYTVNVPGQDTVTFTLKNSAKPGLRIIKYDRQTHETL